VNVVVSSRHMEVTPALKTFAEQKVAKLTKYYDRIQEIEVVLNAIKEAGKDSTDVEVIVNAEHKQVFVVHHRDGDAYACIDACVQKLERQLSEHKKMHRNRKHPEEPPKKSGI
jgi:putative sigma-54 modulation protein